MHVYTFIEHVPQRKKQTYPFSLRVLVRLRKSGSHSMVQFIPQVFSRVKMEFLHIKLIMST